MYKASPKRRRDIKKGRQNADQDLSGGVQSLATSSFHIKSAPARPVAQPPRPSRHLPNALPKASRAPETPRSLAEAARVGPRRSTCLCPSLRTCKRLPSGCCSRIGTSRHPKSSHETEAWHHWARALHGCGTSEVGLLNHAGLEQASDIIDLSSGSCWVLEPNQGWRNDAETHQNASYCRPFFPRYVR